MRKFLKNSIYFIFIFISILSFSQMQERLEEVNGEHEFFSRMQIENIFNSHVIVETGLNLGEFSVTNFKSGNDKKSSVITVPNTLKIKPVTVLVDWNEASGLICWFKRIKQGKNEKKDIQIYVRHKQSNKNHLHITLFKCWPSSISLHPFEDNLPMVSVTFQVENTKCHLPPLLKLIGN